ncbi:MAG: bifunctional tetrahydrofolate synthase/dihydrofolate synthase [Candidatus Cloacimonetes bacterium HGW-Cloacimonetes-1]|jgi:dihydrofolate synthase/folylpolyglutamate synthase|nr:MAG: bifunctional tetrahydrofolate synthase/dihydrofolate synthase [Candidatus Cloacimonetes bacterium HGW-Cloacimonetes-1]
MQYQEFLDHIYQKYSGNVKLELDRMVGILADLNEPQKAYHGIHVAGTNGKGSVCATTEALALAHGLNTGLNTSPHLIDYTERFRISGKDLEFETILDSFQKHESIFEKWDASFFEITTAIAFDLFREAGIDTAVIEVGLGGRLDATNLFCPDVAAITTIGLDHIKTLGGTVEIIAAEKAGIIKAGIPVVLGKIDPSPLQVITDIAAERKAPIYLYNHEYFVNVIQNSIDGITFDYRFEDHAYSGLKANLIGSHQANNIATALTAFILYCRARDITLSEAAIRQALNSINWRGRMQLVSRKPLVIADGAHNVQGIQALSANLKEMFRGNKVRFVLSILADKDFKEMVKLICEEADMIYVAQNKSDRAATIDQQTFEIVKYCIPFQTADSVKAAFALALSEAEADDIIICGGSLYTVGEVLSSAAELSLQP